MKAGADTKYSNSSFRKCAETAEKLIVLTSLSESSGVDKKTKKRKVNPIRRLLEEPDSDDSEDMELSTNFASLSNTASPLFDALLNDGNWQRLQHSQLSQLSQHSPSQH